MNPDQISGVEIVLMGINEFVHELLVHVSGIIRFRDFQDHSSITFGKKFLGYHHSQPPSSFLSLQDFSGHV